MLSRLVTISEILQQVHSEFEEASKQEDPAIGEAKQTLAAKAGNSRGHPPGAYFY